MPGSIGDRRKLPAPVVRHEPRRERRPGTGQPFALDRHNLLPGNVKAGGGQPPGLAHGGTLVLGVYNRCEDCPAARFC
jgi:hypothetical protein